MKSNQLSVHFGMKYAWKKSCSAIFFLTLISFTFSFNFEAKATNVTINTHVTFSTADGNALYDDDGSANGIITVNGNLIIQNNGAIICNDSGPGMGADPFSACPIRIHVDGFMFIESGGGIYSDNHFASGDGGLIEIITGGDFTIHGGGVTSASRFHIGQGPTGNGYGGPITITSGGNINLMPGSVVTSSVDVGYVAGDIRITANGTIDIDGLVAAGPDTLVLEPDYQTTGFVLYSDGGIGSNQQGGKIFIISHAGCGNGPAVTISTEGIVVSQGRDPGSDTIYVEGCGILVNGLLASVSKKLNGSIGQAPRVILRSGTDITVNGQGLDDQQSIYHGRIRADVVEGEDEFSKFVQLYAKDNIVIHGPSSWPTHAVTSLGGSNTNMYGGTITAMSHSGAIALTGLSMQANGGPGSGSRGGTLDLQAKLDVNVSSSSLQAKGSTTGGDPHGGHVYIRSYTEDIESDLNSLIDVTGGIYTGLPDGTVDLTACGTIGFPPGDIIPAVRQIPTGIIALCSPNCPTIPGNLPECGITSCDITGDTSICQGDSSQFCASTADSYVWSTGETTQCIYVKTDGMYSVTTASNGCSSYCERNLTVNSLPICLLPSTSILCSGGTSRLCAGNGFSSYLWNTGETIQCIEIFLSGPYTVTVTNANGCSKSCFTNVNSNLPPNCSITGDPTVCQDGTKEWCATEAPVGLVYTYQWYSGETTRCIDVSTAGTDTVTITEVGTGCHSSCHKSMTISSPPICTISGNGTCCPSGTTELCATSAPAGDVYTYLWSNNATSKCIPVNSGTYTVTITNSAGCSSTCCKTVTSVGTPSCTITGNSSCCPSGTTQLCAPSAPAGDVYTYLWSNNATSKCIPVSSGTYTVTVTNSAGCSSTCCKTVTSVGMPSCTISGNSSCCPSGTTQLCAPSAPAGNVYTYLWNTNATSRCIPVSSGTYTVTVTNSAGCSSTCCKTVTSVGTPSCTITGNSSCCPSGTTQLCAPSAPAGNVYTYLWSNNSTSRCIPVSSGTHTVTVTNSAGCSNTCSKTVTSVGSPSCTITGNSSCCPSGTTQLCAPSAPAGEVYTYRWSNNSTSRCIPVSSGTYTVTVTNSAGCSSTCCKTVTSVRTPSCTITGNSSCCPSGTTQLCAPSAPAGDVYTYLWSNNSTSRCIPVSSGTYTVTVTNSAGCSSTCCKTVTSVGTPSCTITGNSSCCPSGTTQLCAPSAPAGNVYTYLWSNNATSRCIPVSSGIYTVTVTNSAGCSSTCSKTVTSVGTPSCTITGNSSCCPSGTTQLCAPSAPTGTVYTYLWNNNATSKCINVSSGTHTVTVTNSAGCSNTCSKTITSVGTPSCTITGNCNITTGQTTSLCAPSGASSYYWNTGASTSCITVSNRGTYSVTVTNSSGCSRTCSVYVKKNGYREVNASGTNNSDGDIDASAYPNPFASSATIEFQKNGDGTSHISVEVYSLEGNVVATLFNSDIEANIKYKTEFHAENLAEGIYVYRIISGDKVVNGKLILLKQ